MAIAPLDAPVRACGLWFPNNTNDNSSQDSSVPPPGPPNCKAFFCCNSFIFFAKYTLALHKQRIWPRGMIFRGSTDGQQQCRQLWLFVLKKFSLKKHSSPRGWKWLPSCLKPVSSADCTGLLWWLHPWWGVFWPSCKDGKQFKPGVHGHEYFIYFFFPLGMSQM